MTTKRFLLIFTCLWTVNVFSQTPTTQDCLGAIPICQTTYSESFVPPGDGNYPNEVNASESCLGGGEIYSIWYTFTVSESGNFGFLLTPNNAFDDYDWGLFNITNADCSDIYDDQSLLVSCNAAGDISCTGPTGATGATSYSNQGGGCNNCPPSTFFGCSPMNALIPVQEGNTYVLMVSNWSQSTNGYTIDFGISEVDIFDTQSPDVTFVDFPSSCTDQSIQVAFSENIQCASVDVSNFELIGPDNNAIPISSVVAPNCSNGGDYDDLFTLNPAQSLMQNGTYTLNIISDGQTDLVDNCDNSTASDFFTFQVNFVDPPQVDLGGDDTFCEGTSVTLDASYPNSTFLWQDGSTGPEFIANQGGVYAVTVTNDCGAVADEVELQMIPMIVSAFPAEQIGCEGEALVLSITEPGVDIEWFDGSTGTEVSVFTDGNYTVSLSNSCFDKELETYVDFVDLPNISLEQDLVLCNGQSYTYDVTVDGGSYLWQDGSTSPTLTISETGLYAVTIQHSCGIIESSSYAEVIPKIEFDLGADRSLCEDAVILDAYSEGPVTYRWQDGSENSMIEANNPEIYRVTVNNICESVTQSVEIKECIRCNIDVPNIFSPNDDGRNDLFEIIPPCPIEGFELSVFDRWGSLLFQTENIQEPWDGTFRGKEMPTGVYVYIIQYSALEGEEVKRFFKNGTVTIVR